MLFWVDWNWKRPRHFYEFYKLRHSIHSGEKYCVTQRDTLTSEEGTNYKLVLILLTVKVYNDAMSNEITSKTVLQWSAGETQKDFNGFWVKVFNGERPPKQLVTLHNKKLSVRQVIEGPENMAPIQNDQPHDGEKFGFKPFSLSVAGTYVLKYIAMLGDREMAFTQFDIVIKG